MKALPGPENSHERQAAQEQVETSSTMTPDSTKELSAEEQMELYEKDLKENDWGHQPC